MNPQTRRQFLEFTGRSAVLGLLGGWARGGGAGEAAAYGIAPSDRDEVVLGAGLRYRILVSAGQRINRRGEVFGFNNDYLALFPVPGAARDALLWVNHEEVFSGYFQSPRDPDKKREEHARQERRLVGGTVIRIRQSGDSWRLLQDDRYNRRIDGDTPIPIVAERPIAGSDTAVGMVGNCAGGVTPWGAVLSCEENFHYFYGDVRFDKQGRRRRKKARFIGWDRFLDRPPEHYGWVVEVDPFTGAARKLAALGRFAHEGATVVAAADRRCVVYMGDDIKGGCVYKFIAAAPGSLRDGVLHVADTEAGRWLPLRREADPRLAAAFRDHTELLIRAREAARIAGGTPQARPEDIEVDPKTGAVYVALTKSRARPCGAILKIEERGGDPLALAFSSGLFLPGGDESGFACPDNMVFDPRGNLWLCTDIPSRDLNARAYRSFKNNGLFHIPMSGARAGTPTQIASAPVGAEFTGPTFTADGRHLFLSVQHPGEGVGFQADIRSRWPLGGANLPRPSVIVVQGPLLDRLCAV